MAMGIVGTEETAWGGVTSEDRSRAQNPALGNPIPEGPFPSSPLCALKNHGAEEPQEER